MTAVPLCMTPGAPEKPDYYFTRLNPYVPASASASTGRRTMKRFFRSLILALLCVVAAAQTAVVRRNVNLRPDASTENDPIETLKPGAHLTLLEPNPTDGFYHVTAPDGQTGFVWGKEHPQPSAGREQQQIACNELVRDGGPGRIRTYNQQIMSLLL